MKATALAPSNIAFIKYWGKKDEVLRLPENGSLSMNLSNLTTVTTVEFDASYTKDTVIINGKEDKEEEGRAIKHIDRIRKLSGNFAKAKVVSENSFPTGTGLSSSASGFAALTVAASAAAGLTLSEKELSILARQGSGSACRSIPNGFVEWKDGNTSEESYAYSIFPETHWDIVDVVAVVSTEKKEVATTEGQKLVKTSPFMEARVSTIAKKLEQAKQHIKDRDFTALGALSEFEALEMHAVMITSHPPLLYWTPESLALMKQIIHWRQEGIEVYFTINTGQDVHLLCEKKAVSTIEKKLKELPFVTQILVNYAAKGAHLVEKHLF